jgi:hypothetical protein
MAAAISEEIVLIRGSIGMAGVVVEAAVMGILFTQLTRAALEWKMLG